jgi:hypothetical protein
MRVREYDDELARKTNIKHLMKNIYCLNPINNG